MNNLLNNDYWEAFGKFIHVEVIAYVEGFDDINFWEAVFKKYAPSLTIQFLPYSHEQKSGKHFVLSEDNLSKVGKHFILCVDSDYDFFIGDKKLCNPFVFHTYTHSIENYKLAPDGLSALVKKSCYMSNIPFSFKKFWQDYSACIYKLFLYILFFERKKLLEIEIKKEKIETEPLLHSKRLIETLSLEIKNINIENNHETYIEQIKQKVDISLQNLSQKYPKLSTSAILNSLSKQQDKIDIISIQKQVFWFIKGHILYNSVITILLDKMIKNYRREMHKKQQGNKVQEYKKKTQSIDWKTLLQDNHSFCLMFETCQHCNI